MKKILLISGLWSLVSVCAYANWQYPGTRLRAGSYYDDGSRTTISVRGGLSVIANSKMQNELGNLTTAAFYYDQDTDAIIPIQECEDIDCTGLEYLGANNVGALPVNGKMAGNNWTAGISLGYVFGNGGGWRAELSYDRISESRYNQSPLFSSESIMLTGGDAGDVEITGMPQSFGMLNSNVSTDIIGAMAFYDFFSGNVKEKGAFVPYVGAGIGYADTSVKMRLTDLSDGGLSSNPDMANFGESDPDTGIISFNESNSDSTNIAGLLGVGFAYGITENIFLDLGARAVYLPKITWELAGNDGESRDLISAKNNVLVNITVGLRFEF